MKIEPQTYEITFPDGEIYYLERMIQADDTKLWKITDGRTGFCLDRNFNWVLDPFPSSRTDEYLKSTRFKYDEAINIILNFRAKEEAERKVK